jgi:hypothetical protein
MEGSKLYSIIADYTFGGENVDGSIKKNLSIKESKTSIDRLYDTTDCLSGDVLWMPFQTKDDVKLFKSYDDKIMAIALTPKGQNGFTLITSIVNCEHLKVTEEKACDLVLDAIVRAKKKFH